MKILAADTALGACSVAVLDGEKILAHRFVLMDRGHAEALAPMADEAMKASGIGFSALDRLAVTTGPGTFTGQRVGLAFMRGMRLALKRPLTGITTLEAMAAAAMEEAGTQFAMALHDAKRGEFYFQMCSRDGALFAPRIGSLEDAMNTADAQAIALAGTGAEAFAVQAKNKTIVTSIRQPDALWVARLALRVKPSEEPVRPLYLRAPDAKLPANA
ncbi:MAG TPA: tRNA (adenosine(37)-N6)-threonylcarbamoyltransferase complex dimerization subunit type 1 TsaB [Rhizomicrobium sp.]|nr:tRNA (adenosine(37)-N6)-threonylcarbamoyltransferase complex dimerization subunit type 1 TsaB [Rhizomicrobium sp.]